MMRKLILLSLLLTLAAPGSLRAQPKSMSDTAFFTMVALYHPLSVKAALLPSRAEAGVLAARGMFDPRLQSAFQQKDFDEVNYWKTWENALIIPVWPGMDLSVSYDDNEGKYLNPERNTPEGGLLSAGIKVPLGQGLFIDERRNALRQAELLTGKAEADRIQAMNDLLLDAAQVYYEWYFQYNRYQLYESFLDLSKARFDAIVQRVIFGDLPAIDSLEALMEVENRTILRNQALLDYRTAQLKVSNYLWNDELSPLQVTDSLLPFINLNQIIVPSSTEFSELMAFSMNDHPELNSLALEVERLDLERRWSAERIKPRLNLEYQWLQDGTDTDFFGSSEDAKFGFQFSMPLFLRTERARLQMAKLKVREGQLEQEYKQRSIGNSIVQSWTEWNTYYNQVEVQKRQLILAEAMLQSESIRFSSGESSLFLVNTREVNLLNNKVKLAEMESKYFKGRSKLYWSAGTLSNNELN